MPKCVENMNFTILNSCWFLINNIKIISNFEREWCTSDIKNWVFSKEIKLFTQQGFECFKYARGFFKHYQFSLNFDDWNFVNKWQSIHIPLWLLCVRGTLPDIYSNKTFFNIFSDGLQRHEAQVLAGWEKNHNPTKKTLMGIYAWGFKVLASNLDWF